METGFVLGIEEGVVKVEKKVLNVEDEVVQFKRDLWGLEVICRGQ